MTPFAVPCVFVLRVRDGQNVESRDYVDHFAFAKASEAPDSLLAGWNAAARLGTD